MTAGNLNRVNLQSGTWDNKGQLVATEITFRDSTWVNETTTPASARYVLCEHVQPDVRMWLLHAMGAFTGDHGMFPATHNVAARAVATRGSSQTTCPIPVALRPKTLGAGPPNFGYTPGEWVTLLMTPGGGGAGVGGYIGWANLDGSSSAAESERELTEGNCGTRVGDVLGTPGVQANIADIWNGRFGLYRGAGGPSINHPDLTGYAYTTNNWPSGSNAYDGAIPPGAHPTADNFVAKRSSFASCADTGTNMNGPNGCATIMGPSVSLNSFSQIATPGPTATDGHARYGTNRRIVTVPVTNGYPGSCRRLRLHAAAPADQHPAGGHPAGVHRPCVDTRQPVRDQRPARWRGRSPRSRFGPVGAAMRKNQKGVAVVEFALILPMLLVLTFITTEFGRAIYQYNILVKSVRDGARYLSIQQPGTRITEARNLIVYGNLAGTGTALAPGLTAANVPAPTWQTAGSDPVINTVRVQIVGYSFQSIFSTAFGQTFGTVGFSDITATMRSHL